jgi:HEAT repeat protein
MIAKAEGDVVALMAALRDPDVRTIAASFLGDIGARNAIPEISRLLSSSNPKARSGAIKALSKLRQSRRHPPC